MKKYTKEIEDFEDEDFEDEDFEDEDFEDKNFEDKESNRDKILKKALLELKEKIKHCDIYELKKYIRGLQALSISDELIAQFLNIPEEQVKELGNQIIENKMTLAEKTIYERDQLIASMEKEDMSEDQAKILEHKVDLLNHILSHLELAKNLLKEGSGIEVAMLATALTEEAVKRLQMEIDQS